MRFNKFKYAVLWGIAALAQVRCTPIDHHYRDYLNNAEKIYPGRVDSIQFMPGNNRAAIRALISTDSRVVKLGVSWGFDGYFETDVNTDDIATFKEVIIPDINEGIYTFDIRTFDGEGNSSMRAEIFGQVYGAAYEANLNNRIINSTRISGEDLIINWFPESADSTLLGTAVSYQTTAGNQTTVLTPPTFDQTVLPDYKADSEFTFRTLFKPTSIAIDTFYAATRTINPTDYFITERTLYSRENWSIAGFSSQETRNDRLADKVLDGDVGTFWIANWSGDSGPVQTYPSHWLTIDMGEILDVDGFFFAQKNGDRKIREMEILIGDDNETWESLGIFGLANIDREYQYLDLDERKRFRYFKIVPTAGHDAQQQPGLAEAGTYYY
ncbi:F5/8 type C domain-containing protein [Parapedobacter composti]|uniref:F5/8 type C domain-containing protein n=1 Tax=Parapedobacter composti TaxID=623281 RepID=A0A1I1JG90_9SPHI|nr:DUF4998 domain-containing protein [Parapedobacter composti]SFC47355.1 F5/8 type C domain-containing protein [Parapedobacter composti]